MLPEDQLRKQLDSLIGYVFIIKLIIIHLSFNPRLQVASSRSDCSIPEILSIVIHTVAVEKRSELFFECLIAMVVALIDDVSDNIPCLEAVAARMLHTFGSIS